MSESNLSPADLQQIQAKYHQLKTQLLDLEWISQGSVIHKPPNAWIWTRKVNAKTVTVALSEQQALLYHQAVANNRKLESILSQMRQLSQQVLQNTDKNPRKRTRSTRPKTSLS